MGTTRLGLELFITPFFASALGCMIAFFRDGGRLQLFFHETRTIVDIRMTVFDVVSLEAQYSQGHIWFWIPVFQMFCGFT